MQGCARSPLPGTAQGFAAELMTQPEMKHEELEFFLQLAGDIRLMFFSIPHPE